MIFLRTVLFGFALFLSGEIAWADPDDKGGSKNENQQGETDAQKLAAALKREEDLKKELEEARKGKKKDDGDEDDGDSKDLRAKARKEKEDAEKTAAQTKDIERALGFNLGVDEFVAKNASLLPNEIAQIVKLAHKETYDNALAKASALKKSIIESYFAVQANLDALTSGQRATLDDYLKLTKTGKEQKAADIYENIFEPALETVRRVKKAEEIGRARSGFASSSDSNAAYKEKLVRASRKTHLGEKES